MKITTALRIVRLDPMEDEVVLREFVEAARLLADEIDPSAATEENRGTAPDADAK